LFYSEQDFKKVHYAKKTEKLTNSLESPQRPFCTIMLLAKKNKPRHPPIFRICTDWWAPASCFSS